MRCAGVVQRGHGAVVCIERTRRVICAVGSSTCHASRRSSVASGNKRARTAVAGVEMQAVSSFHRGCLWGNREYVSPQYQVRRAWVRRYTKYNHVGCQDIPECYITKRGQEPTSCVKLQYTGSWNPSKDNKKCALSAFCE